MFEKAEAEGATAIQPDGKFIDYPMIKITGRIMGLASMIGIGEKEGLP